MNEFEQADIDTLRQQLTAAEARVTELETCNQLNATEMQRYQIQSARLESERDTLKAELERVYAHNHDLEDAIAMGEHTVEVLEGRLATAWEQIERIANWPDGGNNYGQANIKRFARAALANGTVVDAVDTQLQRYRELARWIERDMLTPARNTCHIPWEALEELVALANGTEAPNCATCRRDNCWPDCARSDDQPELPQ